MREEDMPWWMAIVGLVVLPFMFIILVMQWCVKLIKTKFGVEQ